MTGSILSNVFESETLRKFKALLAVSIGFHLSEYLLAASGYFAVTLTIIILNGETRGMDLRQQRTPCPTQNAKYQKIKSSFLEIMHEQTKETKINYYDFLLVAKKLNFRFEESSHLMALKNFFAKNKNLVLMKKIADLLCISQ